MSSAAARLAERKRMLVARSALQRLEITQRAVALRAGLRWPRAGAALLASPPIRSALLGVLMGAAGRGKLSRLVRVAAIAFVLVRTAGAVLGKPARVSAAPPPGSPPAAAPAAPNRDSG